MSKQHLDVPKIVRQNESSSDVHKDRIFLLDREFDDPKLPSKRYFCPYSNQIEGVLASFPHLQSRIEVVRLPFRRPRQTVIDLLGEDNQGLPVLIFGNSTLPPDDAKVAGNQHFIADTRRILELLAERHDIPWPH
ncbi:DUF3088 domain-containing protein [Phyllobacterium sp. SB3]|uniref:DUF3088 domain-containing protein n=1 Tax=Phyllobacterium sp. SB3 TaxID=3156073 RepID=UPI0032AECEE0